MHSQTYYLVRSKQDGSYLVARPNSGNQTQPATQPPGYLLVFSEHYDALSYLNTHGAAVADRFGVESVPSHQLEGLLTRWGFAGIGIVQDPLIPRVEFLTRQTT
jgi:hypothetical protein